MNNRFIYASPTVDRRPAVAQIDTGVRQDLDQILARVQYLIGAASKAISQRYFDHAQGPQLLVKNTEWQDHL